MKLYRALQKLTQLTINSRLLFAGILSVTVLLVTPYIMPLDADAAISPNVSVTPSTTDAGAIMQTIIYRGTVTRSGTLVAVNLQIPNGSTTSNLRSTSGTLTVHPTNPQYLQWRPARPLAVRAGARLVIPAEGISFGPAGTYSLGFRAVGTGSGAARSLSSGNASITLVNRSTACPTSWPSIAEENSKPGLAGWQITGSSYNGDILSGYAERYSTGCGDNLYLRVDSAASRYVKLSVLRMGYYNGAGARKVWETTGSFVGPDQTAPRILNGSNSARPDNMASAAHWSINFGIKIDGSYTPGVYLIKLDDQAGHQAYIPITVRDRTATSHDYALVQANTTWQAYNTFGGRSFYSTPGSARLTFQRPYIQSYGSGQFLSLEYGLLYWMERQGYDVTYLTDMDLHRYGNAFPGRVGTLVLPAHDEYYSAAMKKGVTDAIAARTNLVSFGANQMFRQIRPDTTGKTFEVYERWTKWADSTTWRYRGYQHNEQAILGAQYGCRSNGAVTTNGSWLWRGVPVGTVIPGFANGETDWHHPATLAPVPAGTEILTTAPLDFCATQDPKRMDIVAYTAPSGARVFGGSTFAYSCFLIAKCPSSWQSQGAPLVVSQNSSLVVQQAVTNVLNWSKYGQPTAP